MVCGRIFEYFIFMGSCVKFLKLNVFNVKLLLAYSLNYCIYTLSIAKHSMHEFHINMDSFDPYGHMYLLCHDI